MFHFGGLRAETVSARIDRDRITTAEINAELRALVLERGYYQRFPGVRFHFGGEMLEQAETSANLGSGLLVVLVAIFFMMVVLFNRLYLPLATLLVIPVSMVAVLVVFVVHDLDLGTAALIGLMGLVGVLVNASLVMIDQVLKLARERHGDERAIDFDAIVDGAVIRFRPLVITAFTTVAGLGPAAYGIAGIHPTTQGMLLVMFWGVAVGAVVTLFALPLLLVLGLRGVFFNRS